MKSAKVYHIKEEARTDPRTCAPIFTYVFPTDYTLVATVNTGCKHVALLETQNDHWDWWKLASVEPHFEGDNGCRETGEGDVVLIGGKHHVVDSCFDFAPLNNGGSVSVEPWGDY